MKRHDGRDVLLRQIIKQCLKVKVIGVKIMKMNDVRSKVVHEVDQVSGRPFGRIPLTPGHAGMKRMPFRLPRLSDHNTCLGHGSYRMGDSDMMSLRSVNRCEFLAHPTCAFDFIDGIDMENIHVHTSLVRVVGVVIAR